MRPPACPVRIASVHQVLTAGSTTPPSTQLYSLAGLAAGATIAKTLIPQLSSLGTNGVSGVSADDRAFLIQLVGTVTGLAPPDAERRVDTTISDARRSISRTRAGSIILSFSLATCLLLGAIAAWAGAEAGGRHRDGMPLPQWMRHKSRFNRRKEAWERATPVP